MNHLASPAVGAVIGNIALLDILCHPWFREGFVEAARGLPEFKGRRGVSERDQWFYERGRLVAIEARSSHARVPQLWCEVDSGLVINPVIISLAGAMLMTGAFA